MKSWIPVLSTFISCTHALSFDARPPPLYNAEIDNGANGFYPTHEYKTLKGRVKAPLVNFLQWSPECDDGLYYFLTPRGYSIPDSSGPMIVDSRGELIWTQHDRNHAGEQVYNFMLQQYKGEDHLTFWMGEDRIKGHGAGYFYILDSSYNTVKVLGGANGLWADLHEGLITHNNTVLITLYYNATQDVSVYKNPDLHRQEESSLNQIWDCVVQELDLDTLALKWEWRATDHVKISDTYHPLDKDGKKNDPWDWYHINSVQKDELGNYLISARFPHSIAYIDGWTQKTIWTLGGKQNRFMDQSHGNATNFAWQHHARFHPTDSFPKLYTPQPGRPGFTTRMLTLFDNAAENGHYTYGLPLSRGLLLELTYPTPGNAKSHVAAHAATAHVHGHGHGKQPIVSWPTNELDIEKTVESINGSDPDYTVRVIMSYDNPDIRSSSQGSLQLIPQGPGADPKVLVGYGLDAAWTEFALNGTTLCDVHFGAKTSFETGEIQSYRVFKFPWTGKPKHKPAVVIENGGVYFSWIGATEVHEWIVQVSEQKTIDETAWRDISRIQKTRFEEQIALPKQVGNARYLRVLALDKYGAILKYGVSDAVDRGILAVYFRNSTLNVFGLAVCLGSVLLAIHEVCRRHLRGAGFWRRRESEAELMNYWSILNHLLRSNDRQKRRT